MTGYCNYWHRPHTYCFLNLLRKHADLLSRPDHSAEAGPFQAEGFQYFRVEVTGLCIENLRCGGNGVFANRLSCKHIREGIRDEEHFAGSLERRTAVSQQCVQLEDGVEVHKLYAGAAVELPGRHFCKEFLLCTVSMRVSVAIRKAEQLTVI